MIWYSYVAKACDIDKKIYVMRRVVQMEQILTQANESNRKERK